MACLSKWQLIHRIGRAGKDAMAPGKRGRDESFCWTSIGVLEQVEGDELNVRTSEQEGSNHGQVAAVRPESMPDVAASASRAHPTPAAQVPGTGRAAHESVKSETSLQGGFVGMHAHARFSRRLPCVLRLTSHVLS